MDKYKQVIIDYAANRIELRLLSQKIDKFQSDNEYIDLSDMRGSWYSQDYAWGGWVAAVNDFEAVVGEPCTDIQKELAVMFDERTRLKQDAGRLKRNMCAYGRALIRQARG